jgi:hypothetical protein
MHGNEWRMLMAPKTIPLNAPAAPTSCTKKPVRVEHQNVGCLSAFDQHICFIVFRCYRQLMDYTNVLFVKVKPLGAESERFFFVSLNTTIIGWDQTYLKNSSNGSVENLP